MTATFNHGLRETGWSYIPSGTTVSPIPGVTVPVELRSSGPLASLPGYRNTLHPELRVTVDLIHDPDLKWFRLRSVEVTEPDGEVTSNFVRQLRLLNIARCVLAHACTLHEGALPEFLIYLTSEQWRPRPFITPFITFEDGSGGYIDRPMKYPVEQVPTVTDIAAVYRLARTLRDHPVKAVTNTFNMNPRIVKDRVRSARDRGLLDV